MHRHLAFFIALIEKVPIVRGMVLDENRCVLSVQLKPQAGNPIFVAVHGTFWLRRTDWIHQNSFLLSSLKQRWSSAGVCSFQWSGVNGIRHRLLASKEFAQELDRLAKAYPSCPLIVIAHSHGGNIAAWASAQATIFLAATVYMSTPFVQILEKPTIDYIYKFRIVLHLGFAACAYCAVKLLDKTSTFLLMQYHGVLLQIIRTMLVLLFLASFGYFEIKLPLIERRLAEIRKTLHSIMREKRKAKHELVLSIVGDEASAILFTSFFIQWLGVRLLYVTGGLLMLWLIASSSFPAELPQRITDKIFLWNLGSGLALLLTSFLVGLIASGLVHGLLALDGTLTVTAAPTGKTESIVIPWSKTDPFRHSHVYRSQEAIRAMTEWLEGKLTSHTTSLPG